MFSRKRARTNRVIERDRQGIASQLSKVTIQIADEFLSGR
jgi:hypothetical protein